MPLLIVGFLLTGIASMPGSYLKSLIVMQIADYNEYNGKPRMEAIIASASNFFNKIGAALGSFILGILLMVGNYDGAAHTPNLDAFARTEAVSFERVYCRNPVGCSLKSVCRECGR